MSTDTKPISLVLADDHPVVLEGIVSGDGTIRDLLSEGHAGKRKIPFGLGIREVPHRGLLGLRVINLEKLAQLVLLPDRIGERRSDSHMAEAHHRRHFVVPDVEGLPGGLGPVERVAERETVVPSGGVEEGAVRAVDLREPLAIGGQHGAGRHAVASRIRGRGARGDGGSPDEYGRSGCQAPQELTAR